VETAQDGEQALDKLSEAAFDIVILDIMMPKIDGLTVLKQLRKAKIDTMVLLLTARGDAADKVKGLDLGAINTMLDRLQYSFVKQREFLFDTAHELKTPLATMRLAVEEIFAADGGKSRSSVEENLLRLQNQTLRMEKLVKDLLNLSALETLAGIDSRSFDFAALFSLLLAEYQFLADAQRIKMEIRLPERLAVRGDPEKLSRAFSNIIDNALKYNLEGGRIEASTDKSATGMTVTIVNTGPGIPEAESPKVFEQFYRVEKSRSSKFGGSGLGLTIAKRIVELHGG